MVPLPRGYDVQGGPPAGVGDAGGRGRAVGQGRAARVEPAAAGDPRRVGHLAGEHHRLHVVDLGDDRQQRAGVGVLRVAQHVLGGAGLDDAAEVHHRDPVGDVPGQAEVVGDDEHAETEVATQGEQQRQDLAADRGVERGDRLVGDEQLGRHRQRAGDQHALALPARQLVRVAQEQPLGRPQAGRRQGGRDQLGLGAAARGRPWRRGGAGGCPRRPSRRRCAAGSAHRRGPAAPAAPGAGRPSARGWTGPAAGRRGSTSPADGGSRPSSARASVVLPDPDSPTSATISPAAMLRSTPSTARATGPPRPWNRTDRPRASSTVSAGRGRRLRLSRTPPPAGRRRPWSRRRAARAPPGRSRRTASGSAGGTCSPTAARPGRAGRPAARPGAYRASGSPMRGNDAARAAA